MPALDASLPVDGAPDRCIVLDNGELLGFFDVESGLDLISEPHAGCAAQDSDLALLIQETGGPDRPTLLFRLVAQDPAVPMREFGPIPLLLKPYRHFADFFRDLARLTYDDERSRKTTMEYLERKGADLFESLFPPDLQVLLWSLRGKIQSLRIESENFWIPWELCRLVGRENGMVVESGFLCEEFVIARWIPGVPRKSSLHLRKIGVIHSEFSDFRGAREELRRLLNLNEEWIQVESIPNRYVDVLRALASGIYDGIHFSGHGMDHENANRSRILLDDIDLRPEDLSGNVANLGQTWPLIFLNACYTGQTGLSLTAPGGWAPKFLRAGAAAFLGSLWEVSDRGAEIFSRTFYQELLTEKKPIGEAVRQARFSTRAALPGNPAWLAYTLFADPLARVV